MKTTLNCLFLIFGLTLLPFFTTKTIAQYSDSLAPIGCGFSMESLNLMNKAYCDYMRKKQDTSFQPSDPIISYLPQTNFPSNLIETCGKFNIYYEDLLDTTYHVGFAETTNSLGLKRRNTLCQVLNYIQSIIYIPDTVRIDLFIKKSLTEYYNVPGYTAYAEAAPFFKNYNYGNVQGVFAGSVYDHITTGIDPDPNNYDAYMRVNFYLYQWPPRPILRTYYISDTSDPAEYCRHHDLYTVLLHEITHTLGWFSAIKEDNSFDYYPTCSNNSFSRFDSIFLYYGSPGSQANFKKLVVFDQANQPTLNPDIHLPNALRSSKIWLNNQPPPTNQPIYSGDYVNTPFIPVSLMSHMYNAEASFINMSQYSPGYQPFYNMTPGLFFNEKIRRWTVEELRILRNFGYTFTNSFLQDNSLNNIDTNSSLLDNSPPNRVEYSKKITEHWQTDYLFADTTKPDTIIINYNTQSNNEITKFVINLSERFNDIDNDDITIFPNSLFGIRGVNDSSNTHDLLVIDSTNKIITYTPKPDFEGRAQFGFYVWDGHEKGAFDVYTVDVKDDFDSIYPFKELILNGGYEDGTEVKTWEIVNQTYLVSDKYYTAYTPQHGFFGEYFGGLHFSSSHPLTGYSSFCVYNSEHSGDIIHNSFLLPCAYTSTHLDGFGKYYACDKTNRNLTPTTPTANNNRYHLFYLNKNLFTLTDSIPGNNKYLFECDLSFPQYSYFFPGLGYNINDVFHFDIDFVYNHLKFPELIQILQSNQNELIINHTYIAETDSNLWVHYIDTISYCSPLYSKFLNMSLPITYSNLQYIDNISLKLLPSLPTTLSLNVSSNEICKFEYTTISTIVTNNCCPPKYLWSTGDTTSSITVSPELSTTYYVTVTIANLVFIDSIMITVHPLPLITVSGDSPVCYNDTLKLFGSGGTQYSWTGPFGWSDTLQNPEIPYCNSSNAGTYYLTVTDTNNCSSNDSVSVSIVPEIIVSASNDSPSCEGSYVSLYSIGDSSYSYSWTGYSINGSNQNQQNPVLTNVSVASTGYYVVTATDTNNCTAKDSTFVQVYPIPVPVVSNDTTICGPGTLTLFASGGENYNWYRLDTAIYYSGQQFIIPNVTPAFSGIYYVNVMGTNGICQAVDSVIVNIYAAVNAQISSNSPVCSVDTIQLYASGGSSYTWSGPGGWTSSFQNPYIPNATVINNGMYYVTVTATGGCTADTSIYVAVAGAHADNSSPTCSGSNINFNSYNQNTGSGVLYSWSGPLSFSSSLQNPSIQNCAVANSGMYYVSITDTNGCVSTDSTIVVVYPALHAGAQGTTPVCTGDTIQLNASGGSTYYWTLPDSSIVSSQNVIITPASLSDSGMYYVTIIDPSGYCVQFDTVHVTVIQSTLAQVSSNSPVCLGDTVFLSASGGISYYWSGPGNFSSNSSNPFIANSSSLNTGYYTVTVSNNNNCDDIHTIYVEVTPCCVEPGTKIFSNAYLSEIINELPDYFAVHDTLFIDIEGQIDSKEIVMMPSSVIDILPGAIFNIRSCYLHGCDTMWGTINVQGDATFISNSSTIEDAEYAITANDYATLDLADNIFHANYVGIYVPNSYDSITLQTLNLNNFSLNKFECENDYLAYPRAGEISYSGILINELNLFESSGSLNHFSYMRNGIRAYNSNVLIKNLVFSHIQGAASNNSYGVYSFSDANHETSLTVIGRGKTGDYSFEDCKYGIYAENQKLSVYDNNMTQMSHAITHRNSPNKDFEISYNNIQGILTGVLMNLNDPVNNGKIQNNDIYINSSASSEQFTAGIAVYGYGIAPLDTFRIKGNIIQNDTSALGIYLLNCNATEVSENTVLFNVPDYNTQGISLINSNYSNVFCNSVFGADTSLGSSIDKYPRGMFVQETYNSRFTCNNFDGTKVGLSFNNNCHDAIIRGNKFYDLTWGLHYNNFARTGPQVDRGNKWLGNYSHGAIHQSNDIYVILLSRYYVKTSFTPGWPPLVYPSTGWFLTSDTSTTQTFNCNSPIQYCVQTLPDSINTSTNQLSSSDYVIASGQDSTSEYSEEIQWLSSRYLYNKLLADSLLVISDTIMSNFYDSIQDASAGRYQQTENLEKEALVLEPVSKHLVDSLNLQIEYIIDSIGSVKKLLTQASSSNDSLTYVLLIKSLNGILSSKIEELQNVIAGIKALINAKVSWVRSEYGLLPSDELYEQNEQVINDIYLESRQTQSFDALATQKETIRNIACQCPLAGGNAVYLARSLYSVFVDTVYNDRQLCQQAGINYKNSKIADKESNFTIFPNPANTSITITWDNISDELVSCSIVNSVGQLVKNYAFNLNSGKLELDIKFLPPGFYEVRISTEQKVLFRGKQVIIH